MMKVTQQIVLTAIVSAILFLAPFHNANAQSAKIGINTVVIDAGHGGAVPGAVGRGANGTRYSEKDINLDVALKFGALIDRHYPNVNVIYTRKTDVAVDLAERGNIANKAGADLFISIHTNSTTTPTPSGTETLVMGMGQAGANLESAMRENDVIVYEEDYTTKYQGYVPGSPESFIIFSLMQYAYQDQSLNFADMVQKQFSRNTTMANRGVKQQPILVLWKTTMPSVLTEFGFMSNPRELDYIASEKGKDMYAQCLFNAFSEYKTLIDGRGAAIVLNGSGGNTAATDTGSSSASAAPPAQNANTTVQSVAARNVVYKVQIASSVRKIAKNSSTFGPYRGEVEELIINNSYKYYVGGTSSYEEALSLQGSVRRSIGDAFIVAFLNGNQIPISEARNLK